MHPHDCSTRYLTRLFTAVLLLALPLAGAAADGVAVWNVTAADATLVAGQTPTVQSRALAAVQAAVHDALNAIDRRFAPYAFDGEPDPDASPDAAVATAAHDALVGLIAVGPLPFAGFGSADQQAALVNLAMADGVIAGFDVKYRVNRWRPITAIRIGDTDDNEETVGDPTWESLLNTPAHPDYPSTHGVQGGAAAVVLREIFGTDQVAFTATSGAPFAGLTRAYGSFSEAAQENAVSRVYGGVHLRYSATEGLTLGEQIGQFIVEHALRPVTEEGPRAEGQQ
jgi:hypothetical protein